MIESTAREWSGETIILRYDQPTAAWIFIAIHSTRLGPAVGGTRKKTYPDVLATALAAVRDEPNVGEVGAWALVLTVAGMASRIATLWRNARLKPRSNLQTAIGIKHPRIVQKAQGFMGGSFNTREFFHGRAPGTLRAVKWLFIAGAFVIPLMLAMAGLAADSPVLLAVACAVQFCGLVAERWFFFAQANHPQNLYYQAVS